MSDLLFYFLIFSNSFEITVGVGGLILGIYTLLKIKKKENKNE